MAKLIITITESIQDIPGEDRHMVGYNITTDVDREGAETTTLNDLAPLCFSACAIATRFMHDAAPEHCEISERDNKSLDATMSEVIANYQSPFPSEL